MALAAALSTVPITATLFLLLSDRRRTTALPFLAGWVVGTAAALILATIAAQAIPARNRLFGSLIDNLEIAVGIALVLFGLYLVLAGIRGGEKLGGAWSLRAMIVLPLAFVLFGVLMTHAGFVPALVALIFGSALASPQFRLIEVAVLTVVLIAAAIAIFIFGLGLPYPLLAGF